MGTATVDTLKIAKLRAELAKEEAKLAEFNKLTVAQKLATEIHERTCHLNHTDMCAWFYETEWTGERAWTHKRYLEKAERMLQIATYDQALEIIEILRGI